MNISSSNSTSFDPLLELTPKLYLSALTVDLIVGLPLNGFVVWLILTGSGGVEASEFFLLNQAVSDIIYCLSAPLYMYQMEPIEPPLNKAKAFLNGLGWSARSLFQCCVCVERYLAVVHPVTFLKYRLLRYRVGCSAAVWLLVLGCCLWNMVTFPNIPYYAFSGLSLTMFTVDMFCFVSILWVLKQPGPGEGGREREGVGMNLAKKKAFKIILVNLLALLIHTLPMSVIITLAKTLSYRGFYLASFICFSFFLIFGFVQPILYLHRARKLPCIRCP